MVQSSLQPLSYPDTNKAISQPATPELLDVLGPRAGAAKDLVLPKSNPERSLVIKGGKRTRKKAQKKAQKKSQKKAQKKVQKKSRKHGYKNCGNNSALLKKYHKTCKKSVVASCCRRLRKNNKMYLKGGSNIIDSASYDIDAGLNTLKGALANPIPVVRSNACRV